MKVRSVGNREAREKEFYNELAASPPATRYLLDRFSGAFYDKSSRGRLWSPFWKSTQLQDTRILDYGCGDGGFSIILARRGARVYGVDISAGLISRARAAAASSGLDGNAPQFITGDAQRLPFADAKFDFVVGNGALHHLDLDQAYAEIARVLRPGGTAVFMEPMYSHPLLWALRKLTPKTHTADERPLSFTDFERAKKWFSTCQHREHFLLAVCAAPAHLLGRTVALSVINPLDCFDGLLMRMFPPLRRMAWLTLMEMKR